jgi:hypothetical protein
VVDLEVEGSRIESTNGYAMSTWNMRIYTGLFRPLKSKTLRIVFGDCIASGCNSGRSTWVCPRGGVPQAALYWPTTLGYKSVSIYPSRLQHGKLI